MMGLGIGGFKVIKMSLRVSCDDFWNGDLE